MQWQGNKPTEQKTIDNLKEYEKHYRFKGKHIERPWCIDILLDSIIEWLGNYGNMTIISYISIW